MYKITVRDFTEREDCCKKFRCKKKRGGELLLYKVWKALY